MDRGSVTFLTLTSSVTCPRLAGAFKFFATVEYHTVGFLDYLFAVLMFYTLLVRRTVLAPPVVLHRQQGRGRLRGSKVYVGVSFLAPPVLSSPSLAVC